MTAGTHILAGVAVALYFKLPVLPAVIGSVLPDVDLKNGFPKRRTLFNAHRGITHHVAIPVFLIFVSLYFKDLLPVVIFRDLFSFSLGYASHLLLDALTPLGIPAGFSYRQRFSLNLLKSGKFSEIVVALLLLLFLAGMFRKEAFTLESFFGRGNISFLMNMLK